MAKAAGYAQCREFSELASFEQQIGHVLGQVGPVFATLKVGRSKPLTYDYPALYRRRQAQGAEGDPAGGLTLTGVQRTAASLAPLAGRGRLAPN